MVKGTTASGARRIVATYDYKDEAGSLLFQVVRYEPKDFRQRRPDGNGGWIWNLNGTRKVLYRLPELIAAARDQLVFICEGEKDCDTLAEHGLLATTNPSGAGKWRSEFNDHFAGRDVAVLYDNDGPGMDHASTVEAALAPVARRLRVGCLPGPEKSDVSDWLDDGHTCEDLLDFVATLPDSEPAATGTNRSDAGVLLSEVRPERVEWLWPGYVPLGKITMLDGDPGLGKSLLTLEIAARISRGEAIAGTGKGLAGGVVLLTAEDGLGDTVRPRLEAAGADLQRIVALKYSPDEQGEKTASCIPVDIPTIRQAIARVAAKMVIVDVLMAYLPAETNTYRDQHVRLALAPLAQMAAVESVAVICIRHLTKALGGSPLYRGGGSIGIIGGARAGLLVAKDPDSEGQIVLAQTKSNLGPPMPSLSYKIEPDASGVPRIQWQGSSSQTATSLLAATVGDPGESGALADAKEFLRAELAGGPRPQKELFAEARRVGISQKTLRRAKAALRVKSSKEGFDAGWHWSISGEGKTHEDGHILEDGHLRQEASANNQLSSNDSLACSKVAKMANCEGGQTTLAIFEDTTVTSSRDARLHGGEDREEEGDGEARV
ncbi:MAG: AAA family ATPase [Acidobacteriales bacterium]|nr:AAA family ATPase [Terriglobales bacterium]MCI0623844.1 AAA family ATPase [Acidobacteriota bacterium]MCI0721816.1 AAA family ATPase [Acidobacteriota bacterium]